MSVKIWPDEHSPPHFHVKFAGEDASFGIADCKRLPNVKGLEKFEHNIKAWWKDNRKLPATDALLNTSGLVQL